MSIKNQKHRTDLLPWQLYLFMCAILSTVNWYRVDKIIGIIYLTIEVFTAQTSTLIHDDNFIKLVVYLVAALLSLGCMHHM